MLPVLRELVYKISLSSTFKCRISLSRETEVNQENVF